MNTTMRGKCGNCNQLIMFNVKTSCCDEYMCQKCTPNSTSFDRRCKACIYTSVAKELASDIITNTNLNAKSLIAKIAFLNKFPERALCAFIDSIDCNFLSYSQNIAAIADISVFKILDNLLFKVVKMMMSKNETATLNSLNKLYTKFNSSTVFAKGLIDLKLNGTLIAFLTIVIRKNAPRAYMPVNISIGQHILTLLCKHAIKSHLTDFTNFTKLLNFKGIDFSFRELFKDETIPTIITSSTDNDYSHLLRYIITEYPRAASKCTDILGAFEKVFMMNDELTGSSYGLARILATEDDNLHQSMQQRNWYNKPEFKEYFDDYVNDTKNESGVIEEAQLSNNKKIKLEHVCD